MSRLGGRLALGAALAAAVAAGGATWSSARAGAQQGPAHVTLLDGDDWVELGLKEKERLVEGFVIGAASRQALARAQAVGGAAGEARPVEGRAVGRTVAELRADGELDVPFAPSLLARRLDEFYWWRDNRDVTVAGALAEINERLRHQHR